VHQPKLLNPLLVGLLGALPHALDVATGGKRAPGAGQHDGADIAVGPEPRERLPQRLQHLARESVQPIGPVQRQRRDAVLDRLGHVGHDISLRFPARL
jgi:hypothetical protein